MLHHSTNYCLLWLHEVLECVHLLLDISSQLAACTCNKCGCVKSWKQFGVSCSSFCLLLLLLLLSVLPGSSLTTDLALDALARVLQLLPSVEKTLHYSTLVIVQPMTVQVKKTNHGPCPYIAHYNTTAIDDVFYIQLPENASLLNEFMCGPLNREGTLCGKCKDGYGIALYSYTLECSKCWGHGYGWVLYYFLELFPITVMYILVVIFHIRAHFLTTECPCVHESDCSLHNTTECFLAHVHWERSNRISICGTSYSTAVVWYMEPRRF